MEQLKRKSTDVLERIAIRATRWIGSTNSIIIHTIFFVVSFVLYFWGISIDKILLVVTTLVSLEAIYLSIFIQMSMNRQTRRLREVARDIDEIQKDVDEIQEDVEEIEKDVDEIQKDVEEINEDEEDEDTHHSKDDAMLTRIEGTLGKLMEEIAELKKSQK
jgi:low affinity Fe/Cu permease